MTKIILLVHVMTIALFFLLILAKAVLMMIGKVEAMERLKKATQIPEGIDIAIGILSGLYLAFLQNWDMGPLFWIKLVLVLITVPVGRLAFRYHKIVAAPVTVLLLLGIIMFSL